MGFVANVKGEQSQRDHPRGPADPRQSRPSRRRRRRSAGRRRRRLPDPDPRRPVPRLGRGERLSLPPPGDYAVAMCFLPRDEESREAAIARLERFVGIEGPVLVGWRDVPVDPTGLGAAVLESMPVIRQAIVARGPRVARPGRVRAQAARDPQADPEPARRSSPRSGTCPASPTSTSPPSRAGRSSTRACCSPTRSGTFYRDLADPLTQVGAGDGPPALLDQHLPVLAAGAPLPLHRPQWRDQHGARQRELDERAPADAGIAVARRRPRQDVADHPARPVGHRLPRQCARAAARRRLFARPCDDAADPRGLGRQRADGAEAPRLLRISCRADGAVGRPGGDRLHRRPPDRRDARPQRPAAGALPASPTTTVSSWRRKAACCRSRRRRSSASGGCSRARCC